ncbi:MAG: hypothetical protein GY862_24720 [Gammaproteobacteria bacterium]|nr:hypothetical protein [Gammaproteobacteria bacterium]
MRSALHPFIFPGLPDARQRGAPNAGFRTERRNQENLVFAPVFCAARSAVIMPHVHAGFAADVSALKAKFAPYIEKTIAAGTPKT